VSSGVALVTGSGRRLGRRIALALAEAGFDIVVNYNQSEQAAKSTCSEIIGIGRQAVAIKADISVPAEVQELVEKSLGKFKRLDVLINNAGIYTRSLWNEINPTLWAEMLDVNMTGTFLCTQAVGREMFQQGGGRIINIASIGGIQAWPRHIPYSVSKSGVIALTRCFARALAPHVMVNAVAPGTIILEGEEKPDTQHISVERIPLGRYGVPGDITSVVLFLAQSAPYITGQIFAVDGGRSIDFLTS